MGKWIWCDAEDKQLSDNYRSLGIQLASMPFTDRGFLAFTYILSKSILPDSCWSNNRSAEMVAHRRNTLILR